MGQYDSHSSFAADKLLCPFGFSPGLFFGEGFGFVSFSLRILAEVLEAEGTAKGVARDSPPRSLLKAGWTKKLLPMNATTSTLTFIWLSLQQPP